MDFAEVVQRRRMVRHYHQDPVSKDRLERILSAALRAPSAGFSQGQSFVVVQDRARRLEVARIAGEPAYLKRGFDPWLSVAPVHVICCVSEAAYRQRYREPDKLAASGGPERWPVPYWFLDAGCSLMLLLLAAVDEGLGAGFIGLDEPACGRLRKLLEIPDEVAVVGLVTVGHQAPDRRSSSLSRGWKPQSAVIHRESWGSGERQRRRPRAGQGEA